MTKLSTKIVLLFVLASQVGGCATLFSSPRATTLLERFESFPKTVSWPVEREVKIHFSAQMIPFVEAKTDADCAFAIGVVHAYLRLGQMEIFRRASAGRISESAGPFGTSELDALLRTLDLGRASAESYKLMSLADQKWLDRYVDGINFFIEKTPELPYEFKFLNYKKEKWTAEDSFRIGRLAGGDVNWSTLLALIKLRETKGWEQIWKNVREGSENSLPSIDRSDARSLSQLLSMSAKTGSNAVVVAGQKSTSGSALIASDPHLGIFMPNLWMLMGYQCPSYQVVGYMVPGVPAVTLGRNKDVAWGGTYMRAVSTHLFEVAPDQIQKVRSEVIKRRGWFDKKIEIKESLRGPVIFDGENPETQADQMIALNWVGHQPSNELGAFLSANRSRGWPEFREGFKDFAVSGLNITFADRSGNIGFLPAVRQPLLNDPKEYELLVKSKSNFVASYRRPTELPFGFNPAKRFFASANNLPVVTSPPLASVVAQTDRFKRWTHLLESKNPITLNDLKEWQLDVYSEDSMRLNQFLVAHLENAPAELVEYTNRLKQWDGRYTVASTGAAAFEILIFRLGTEVFEKLYENKDVRSRALGSDDWRLSLERELRKLDSKEVNRRVMSAMAETQDRTLEFRTWGSMHVQRVQTPLGLIPLLGRRLRFGEYEAPGGSSTIHKAAFVPGLGKREVIFGAQARHVSDLSDPDENYFVMLGGNDGWLESASLMDQLEPWKKGELLKIPLSIEMVRSEFTLNTISVQRSESKTDDRSGN